MKLAASMVSKKVESMVALTVMKLAEKLAV
jgi:hypothetical protein